MNPTPPDGIPESLRRALEQMPITSDDDSDDWKANSDINLDDNNDDVLVIGIDFGTT